MKKVLILLLAIIPIIANAQEQEEEYQIAEGVIHHQDLFNS